MSVQRALNELKAALAARFSWKWWSLSYSPLLPLRSPPLRHRGFLQLSLNLTFAV